MPGTTPRGWWRSSVELLSRAFSRSSTGPTSRWGATRPGATATPPSPSATRHDSDRDLPRLLRSTDEGPRGPDPPEPGPGRPGDRRRGDQRGQATALLRGGAPGA